MSDCKTYEVYEDSGARHAIAGTLTGNFAQAKRKAAGLAQAALDAEPRWAYHVVRESPGADANVYALGPIVFRADPKWK